MPSSGRAPQGVTIGRLHVSLHLALYDLAARYNLDAGAFRRLRELSGVNDPPAGLAQALPRAIAVLAAILGGFGITLWIAANWETLGRLSRFVLLQGFIVAMGVGALARPAARVPFVLAGFLAIGGTLAYYGQTYQTGADPWQLFAVWALLALPGCLACRSDVLWTPWSLVTLTAVSLWLHAHVGHRWAVREDDLWPHAIALGLAVALAAAFAALPPRLVGTGVWARRTSLTLAAAMVTLTALGGLFLHSVAPHYVLGLLLLAGLAAFSARPGGFDLYGLSFTLLGLNVLLVSGLGRLLLDQANASLKAALLMIGLAAVGLLAATVSLILGLARGQRIAKGGAV